jgi:hypothetical protein
MTIIFSKNNTVPAQSIWDKSDVIELTPLVASDYSGLWRLRYLWIKHREKNDDFINNYFKEGSDTGLNVRKQTSHLQNSWESHNKIFDESKENGNLVWRVKIFNTLADSIDYIEVWRSSDILTNLWGDGSNNSGIRTPEDKHSLSKGLYESGFDIRTWYDPNDIWIPVSKSLAIEWYFHFVNKWKEKDNCIINTPWNRLLNPAD